MHKTTFKLSADEDCGIVNATTDSAEDTEAEVLDGIESVVVCPMHDRGVNISQRAKSEKAMDAMAAKGQKFDVRLER